MYYYLPTYVSIFSGSFSLVNFFSSSSLYFLPGSQEQIDGYLYVRTYVPG